jgi:hypothetical protein
MVPHLAQWGLENYSLLTLKIEPREINVDAGPKRHISGGFSNERGSGPFKALSVGGPSTTFISRSKSACSCWPRSEKLMAIAWQSSEFTSIWSPIFHSRFEGNFSLNILRGGKRNLDFLSVHQAKACKGMLGIGRIDAASLAFEQSVLSTNPAAAEGIRTSEIRSRIGVSRWYAGKIRKGYCQHPRHWQALARLAGISSDLQIDAV